MPILLFLGRIPGSPSRDSMSRSAFLAVISAFLPCPSRLMSLMVFPPPPSGVFWCVAAIYEVPWSVHWYSPADNALFGAYAPSMEVVRTCVRRIATPRIYVCQYSKSDPSHSVELGRRVLCACGCGCGGSDREYSNSVIVRGGRLHL